MQHVFIWLALNLPQLKLKVQVKVSAFCIATLAERSLTMQYRFTSWQATGKNDAWSSAHCGLRRVSPIAPTPAASLVTRRPCSRAENVNPQPKPVPIHRPRGSRDERLGWPGFLTFCELTPCPRMLRIGLYMAGLRFETGPPGLDSSALTTRPTRLVKVKQ